jgi:LytR cell envelope-related transcriptional attenuator
VALRTERPPVRARSGRRPLPPLIFLLVLALAALGVWWNVLRQHDAQVEAQERACATAATAAPSLDPATVQVRVHNATDKAGEAQKATIALTDRGFAVVETGNDPTAREVTGVGEIRFGARGREAAAFLGVFVPGAGTYEDVRADARVDLVIGPDYAGLASPEEVAAAFTPAASAAAAC